jgi:hypothetical protein
MQQQLQQMQQYTAQRQQHDAQQVLDNWSKDKPHFAAVRAQMSQLIATGMIPLKDGNVDLDGAYEAAVWMNPEVRAQIEVEKQQKAQEAQKATEAARAKAVADAAAKAKAAAISLAPAAPGSGTSQAKPKKGKSVRESLNEVIADMRS